MKQITSHLFISITKYSLIGLILITTISIVALLYSSPANAISSKGFNASNIMSDAVMGNKNTMTQSQIQSFMNSRNACKSNPKSPSVLDYINSNKTYGYLIGANGTKFQYHLKNGKFVCLADQSFSGESAARIIYRAAQDYSINPQVLLVLLQKENGLITDNWPNYNFQYATATGYACPDSGPNNSANCNNNYFGFKNQIRHAAGMFRTLLNGQGWNNYPVGNNNILHSPNCSSTARINVKNRATGALYTYTPYTPNSATLNRSWPVVQPYPSCSAFGNLNFYMYFTQWFGSTHYATWGAIDTKYKSTGGIDSYLGEPLSREIKTKDGGVYQKFTGGYIYWSKSTGAHIVRGGIKNKYLSSGSISKLGLPTSDEISFSSGVYQEFKHGRIYWSPGNDTLSVHRGMYNKYLLLNGHTGSLGLPTSDETIISGGVYQQFSNGRIYWSKNTSGVSVVGDVLNYYKSQPNYTSVYGFPTKDQTKSTSGTFQVFENVSLYIDNDANTTLTRGGIRSRYVDSGGPNGNLGFPVNNEGAVTGGTFQEFENGRIYWSPGVGAWSVSGNIKGYFEAANYSEGHLGFPTSNPVKVGDMIVQKFQKGTLYSTDGGTYNTREAIGNRYKLLNSEDGFLGLPTSDEKSLPNAGMYQEFENGRIYWSRGLGAWDIHGAINTQYKSMNSIKDNYLGYPISGEIGISATRLYQKFERGNIYWSSRTGAYSVYGGVKSKYLAIGGHESKLRLPISNEIATEDGVYQKFEGGNIHWKPGSVTVEYK